MRAKHFAPIMRGIAVREGEEGTVILKNDNGVLPMTGSKNVALFGLPPTIWPAPRPATATTSA